MAEAARHEITTDTSISSDETSTYADGVKMNASNIALTITSTGKVKMIESAGYNNNTITVQGNVASGSSASSAIWGAATGTKVYIKTGANVQGEIYAGRDDTSEVSGNKLDISSGTIEGNIFGGVNNNITAYDVKNITLAAMPQLLPVKWLADVVRIATRQKIRLLLMVAILTKV